MSKKVRIVLMPPGFAPEEIRQQWVGVEIPLIDQDEADALQDNPNWDASEQYGGSIVSTSDAIAALREAGREEAAQYWEEVQKNIGIKLRFGAEYCEIL